MLYPDEIFKITWELVMSAILLISVFLTPYQMAFPDIEQENAEFSQFLDFVNGMFYADICMNFIIAYEIGET